MKLLPFLISLLLPAISANAETFGCPATITISETIAETPAVNYSVWNDVNKLQPAIGPAIEAHKFLSLGISDGPPNEIVWLKPEEFKNKSIWDLTATLKGAWLSCHYDQTSITLVQELPKKITSCEYEEFRSSSINCKLRR